MKLITVKELSESTSIKEATLYLWATKGEIPHYKIGQLVRFKPEEVEDWLEKHKKSVVKKPLMSSFKTPENGSLDPIDIGKNAIAEVLGSRYNPSQRGNQTEPITPGKEGD